MISRYIAICKSCEQKFILRVVVPLATTEAFRYFCPSCKIELWANLKLDYKAVRMDIDPQGFSLEVPLHDHGLTVVTISTDLPVHKLKHTKSLSEGGSPFLFLRYGMGSKFFIWKEKVDSLQQLRHNSLDYIRKLVDYARIDGWDDVKKHIENFSHNLIFSNEEIPKSEPVKTIYICYRIINSIYAPLISMEQMIEFLDEYYCFLNDCIENKQAQYKQLIESWKNNHEYKSFRSKVLGTFLRILTNFDSFTVGLLYNEMPSFIKDNIDDYRIFRDDYPVVKGLYQDIFELTSQLLIFLGAVVNLSKRNDPWHFSVGTRSYKAFKKKTACQRFQILSETPKLNELLSAVSRPMRNTIGHFSADYECRSGDLIYDDGVNINYIAFLGQFFYAVKALWFMLVFVEKMDIDTRRF